MQIGNIQAIIKWRMSDDQYLLKIQKTLSPLLVRKINERLNVTVGVAEVEVNPAGVEVHE